MKKLFIPILALLLCATANVAAETVETCNAHKHEIRFGVGDNFTDLGMGAFHETEHNKSYVLPNLFVDYTYHFTHWFGLGLQINTIWWGGNERNRFENAEWQPYLYSNTSIMPTLRFTYFHTDKNNVALYSTLYGGYCLGFDKYSKERYRNGFAVGATALGVSFGQKHWFGAFELGTLLAFGASTQLGSRLLSLSVGYRL